MTASASRRRDWVDAVLLTCFLWTMIVVLYLPVLFARHPDEGIGSAVIEGATVLLAMALGIALFVVDRAVKRLSVPVRLLILMLAIICVSAIQTTVDFAFTYWVAHVFKPHWSKAVPTLAQSYSPFFQYICLFAFNVALFQLVFWRRSAAFQRERLAEAMLAAKQAELTALRFQLNPHFLFNSLNAISALIVTRRYDDADEMTTRLSGFLRKSLGADPATLVPLETEIATIEDYLNVEEVRFQGRLEVEIDTDEADLATPVPSFILQPLVENAVKYGAAPAKDTAVIRIVAADEPGALRLAVVNSVPAEAAEKAAGAGVGLANIRQRLAATYGAAASLRTTERDGTFEAVLRVPR